MEHSEKIGQIAKALSLAQAEFGAIEKDKTATVPTKSGGKYTYTYADLASVLDATRKPLAAHGLALLQPTTTEGQKVIVTTLLAHESGEWIRSLMSVSAVDDRPQSIGAAVTYARRYGITAMLGLAPEEEDRDANDEAEIHQARRVVRAVEGAAVSQPSSAASGNPPPPPVDEAARNRLARLKALVRGANMTWDRFVEFAAFEMGWTLARAGAPAEYTDADITILRDKLAGGPTP